MDVLEQVGKQLYSEDAAFVSLSDDQIDALTPEQIAALQDQHGSSVLLKLPPREQAFFAWLNDADPDVWDDLWQDDEDLLVALTYLPQLRKGGRGFPICELENNPNYFFTQKLLTPQGLEQVPRVLELARLGKELAPGEALLFEIMVAPIDIWRFCYKYGLPLAFAKEMVHELYQKNILVHLTEREDLIRYMED